MHAIARMLHAMRSSGSRHISFDQTLCTMPTNVAVNVMAHRTHTTHYTSHMMNEMAAGGRRLGGVQLRDTRRHFLRSRMGQAKIHDLALRSSWLLSSQAHVCHQTVHTCMMYVHVHTML